MMEHPAVKNGHRLTPILIVAISTGIFLAAAMACECDAFVPVSVFRTTVVENDSNSARRVGRNIADVRTATPKTETRERNEKKSDAGRGVEPANDDRIKNKQNRNDLDPIEKWCLHKLEYWYERSQKQVRCPFFRRRYGDVLDKVEDFVRFFLVRPYFLDSSHRTEVGPRMAYRSSSSSGDRKTRNLPIGELLEILRGDWGADRSRRRTVMATDCADEKGYYVTGRLSQRIYRDDCQFLSPDPDLPLRGVRKYVGVASQIFHSKSSFSKLISLEQVPASELVLANDDNDSQRIIPQGMVLKATWKLSATINLPWKPQLSEFTGSTLYFLDHDHLIFRHQETWDITVWDAFLAMMNMRNRLEPPRKKGSGTKAKCPLAMFARASHPLRHQERFPPSLSTNSTLNCGN